MSTKLLKTEETISRKEASEKMANLAEKIGEGELEIRSGEGSVKLEPSETVEFEVEVEEEQDGDLSLEVELEWSDKEDDRRLEIS